MKTSNERILTTHVGSLPRSKAVTDGVFAKENDEAFDALSLKKTIAELEAENKNYTYQYKGG